MALDQGDFGLIQSEITLIDAYIWSGIYAKNRHPLFRIPL
jgi:hypothetical protein